VTKNSAVNLVVSGGPTIPIVTVPDVTNEQLVTAEAKLTAAGLTYTQRVVSSNQPQGTVLAQNPAGGSRVRANVPVALTVSGTQTSVSVPTVIGQSPSQAGAILAHAGLSVGNTTSACSDQFPPGAVSDQSPPGNTNVAPNTPVNITVASGSCAPPTTTTTTAPPTTTTTTAPPTTTTTTGPPTTTTAPAAPTGAAAHAGAPAAVPQDRGNGQG
jgi:serine/threonine-protein kinase